MRACVLFQNFSFSENRTPVYNMTDWGSYNITNSDVGLFFVSSSFIVQPSANFFPVSLVYIKRWLRDLIKVCV